MSKAPNWPRLVTQIQKDSGLSAAELAQALRVSITTVVNWQNKRAVPRRFDAAIMIRLAKKLRLGTIEPMDLRKFVGGPNNAVANPKVCFQILVLLFP